MPLFPTVQYHYNLIIAHFVKIALFDFQRTNSKNLKVHLENPLSK